MDDNLSKKLQYGHMGKAVYYHDTRSWSFSRSLAPPPRLTYTGVTKIAVQSPSTSTHQSTARKKSYLSRGYPELIAGFRFAPSETLSHTITVTSEACNPSTSALLDFGRALDYDIETSGRRAVSIAAFASGECGNTISLRTIAGETVDLRQATITELRIPTIGDKDAVEWSTERSPIRQICFSYAPEERATFMAARSTTTAIFRPLYRRSPVCIPTHGISSGTVSSHQISRLDPNLLVEISTSHTGGFAHADIKFNPWNQNQLAIVDEDGRWGIWELSNQHKRNKDHWVATCVISGSLPWIGIEEGQGVGFQGRHDGWLAAEWAGTEHHIIVCDRRCSMLYRIEKDQTYSYAIELGFKRKSEWILGIKRSDHNPSHIFILTTSWLHWFDVTPDSIPIQEESRPSLYPRLSWRHFRDTDDLTLQLSSLGLNDDFYVVLYSRLNQLVQAFHCPEHPEDSTESVTVNDPFILEVPASSDCAGEPEAFPGDMRFSTLVFKQIAAVDEKHRDQKLDLCKAFVVDSSFRVQESLFSRPLTTGESSHGKDILRITNLRLAGLQKKGVNSYTEFIVDDWDESSLGPKTILDRGIGSIAPLADPHFTLDFTQIYAIATGVSRMLPRDGKESARSSFQGVVKELANLISSHDHSNRLISLTALDLVQRTPVLDDIDQNAQDMGEFVSQFASGHLVKGNRNRLLVHPFDPFRSQRPEAVEIPKLDLVAVYDRLVNNWLVNLPYGIPGRARIAKEKAIRHFVADLMLAQIISVHQSFDSEHVTSDDRPQSFSSAGGLINLSGAADEHSSLEPLATQGSRSQASIAATQSSSVSENFISPDHQAEILPTFTALSSYTNFYRPEAVSRETESMLDHWQLGGGPTSYKIALEVSDPTARIKDPRRKSRKKMSLSMKNMSLGSSVPLPVSSPTPVVRDWGSQPENSQLPLVQLQSSQITEDLPTTQPERGAFGGREAIRKGGLKMKKKKRAAGF
ncbi:RNA polymerase I-specific transcription initiation factor RRN6-like protein [Aspergillus californicus]